MRICKSNFSFLLGIVRVNLYIPYRFSAKSRQRSKSRYTECDTKKLSSQIYHDGIHAPCVNEHVEQLDKYSRSSRTNSSGSKMYKENNNNSCCSQQDIEKKEND